MNTVLVWLQNNILTSIIIPIICSVIATRLFWWYSFRSGTTKIQFSPSIEKSTTESETRYRFRLINIGKGNLYDVKFMARMSYRTATSRPRIVYLKIGQRSEAPMIFGRKEQKKRPKEVLCWTLRINPGDEFFTSFSSKEHPPQIVKKAKNKTLTLTDVINQYGGSFSFSIYLFGTDSITGVEKVFHSPRYRVGDIKTGRFKSAAQYLRSYKNYVDYVMQVEEKVGG